MTAYVCGFAFDTLGNVALIRKIKPTWQYGLLNGVGGKIELGDLQAHAKADDTQRATSLSAMTREFNEEAGLFIDHSRWKLFHREQWPNGNSVNFYTVGLNAGEIPSTQTDEPIVVFPWRKYNSLEWSFHQVMYNLPYLIPMAFCHLYGDPANLPYHALPETS